MNPRRTDEASARIGAPPGRQRPGAAPAGRSRSVLILDDEPSVVSLLGYVVQGRGFEARGFQDPAEALRALDGDRHAVLVVDFMMPGMDGVTFLAEARRRGAGGAAVMITAAHDFETALLALNDAQVFRLVPKPWESNDVVAEAIEAAAARDDARRAQAEVGAASALQAARLAALEGTVAAMQADRLGWLAEILSGLIRRLAPEVAARAQREVVLVRELALSGGAAPRAREAAVLAVRLAAVAELLPPEAGALQRELLQLLDPSAELERIVREQHERWDGRGPLGLAGQGIHQGARLLHAARLAGAAELLGERPGALRFAAAAGNELDPALVGPAPTQSGLEPEPEPEPEPAGAA